MAERDALVEHKTFAAPAALALRHTFQISEDAALEVKHLGKAAREQIGAGLFAADAAGAEHRDPAMLLRIECACRELLELAEAFYAGIDRALERAHRDLESVARVENQRLGIRNQLVPTGSFHVSAHSPGGIDAGGAERDDLLLQPHLQALERHSVGSRVFQLEMVEPAA